MEARGLIKREAQTLGKSRSIYHFKASPEGLEFFKEILEPYETMFPRVQE
jgi:hypothetical protein